MNRGAKGKAKAAAHPLARAVELHGTICVEAPPAPCDGVSREASWTQPWDFPVYVTGGYVWQGIGRGCRADVGFQLYVKKNANAVSQLMRVGMWDHYQDPCGAEDNISPIDLGGHYFVVDSGGSLTLCYQATLVGLQDGPGIDAYGTGQLIAPWDYFRNIMGQQQQAYLYFSLTQP